MLIPVLIVSSLVHICSVTVPVLLTVDFVTIANLLIILRISILLLIASDNIALPFEVRMLFFLSILKLFMFMLDLDVSTLINLIVPFEYIQCDAPKS
jgi:hypothetical protein